MLRKGGKWASQHIKNIFTSLSIVLDENIQDLVIAVVWGVGRTAFEIYSNDLGLGCKGCIYVLQQINSCLSCNTV